MEIKNGYVVDGKVFDTKAEAADYMRRPSVHRAAVITAMRLLNAPATSQQIYDAIEDKGVGTKKQYMQAIYSMANNGIIKKKTIDNVVHYSDPSEKAPRKAVKKTPVAKKRAVVKKEMVLEPEQLKKLEFTIHKSERAISFAIEGFNIKISFKE
jgi:Fe2+ or Zn2+ uptake regulation protein